MTDKELQICRMFGAHWATRERGNDTVSLWKKRHKPEYMDRFGIFLPTNGGREATVKATYMPHVHEGECVEVPEQEADNG